MNPKAKKKEQPVYGSCTMLEYKTAEEYYAAIAKLKADGKSVQD